MTMKTHSVLSICLTIIFSMTQCGQKKAESQAEKEAPAKKPISYSLEKAWATDSLFKTPESVIYDSDRDILYVANVNENPWEKDNNGFISILTTSGDILALNWISGLSAPKGMAIVGNILYVADIDEIGVIDIEKGEMTGKIKVEGAQGLNDITPDNNGGIFISDSNGGKIFQYSDGKVTEYNGDVPGRPNGVFVDQGKLLVAFSQASEFVGYDLKTKEKTVIAKGIGAGDGIAPTYEAGTYLVSDWNGEIFAITPDGNKQSLLMTKDQKKNTADIWSIPEMDLVLVPTFFDNRVVAYKLVMN